MPLQPLVPRPTLSRSIISYLTLIPLAVFLLGTLFPFNALQVLSVVIYPFSRPAFRAINRFIANTWWGWCVSFARFFYGIRTVNTGDMLPEGENALIIANHQDMADVQFLWFLAKDHRQLGNLKCFVKDIIKYVPGVGWGVLFLDYLFVKRNWLRDQKKIERVFSKLTSDHVPYWIVTFCEGTRSTPAKIEKSRSWAKKNKRAPLNHLLIPRTAGFAASVQGLGKTLGSVYDITIGYPEGVPTLWHYIQGFAREAHLHVRRYPVSELPVTKEELSEWLYTRFEEKDALLEQYYATGSFLAPENSHSVGF